MLDVHAPDHSIHGVRDFFMHLLTITAGLLIALGLEASVETMHHRHQRREAEENIRQELRQNREILKQGTPELASEMDNIVRLLAFLTARSENQPATVTSASLRFHEAPIPDAAWRTAGATGVLSFMDYGEVQRFSAAYKEQEMLQTAEEQALEDFLELKPMLPASAAAITPALATEALPTARRALAHLSGMEFIGSGTIGSYDEALKEQ